MLEADDKKELKEYILKIKSELAQVSFFFSEKTNTRISAFQN
jgi:hypothetical protein